MVEAALQVRLVWAQQQLVPSSVEEMTCDWLDHFNSWLLQVQGHSTNADARVTASAITNHACQQRKP
jgi:hypothetical protein